MELVLLSLLGVGALFAVNDFFDRNRSDEDDGQPVDPPPPDPTRDQTFEVVSGDTLNAGDGDDTITAADDFVETATVDGGAGNDLLDFARTQGTHSLFGGEGQDTITSFSAYGTQVDGGSGDDEIFIGGQGTDAFGGIGDDQLTAYRSSSDESKFVFGGVGEDTLTMVTGIDQDRVVSNAQLIGDEGQDDYVLRLQFVSDPVTIEDDPRFGYTEQMVSIREFNPEEDRLVVDLTELDADSAAFSALTIEEVGQHTEVLLSFANGAQGSIFLLNTTGLTANDINIVT